MKRLFSFTVMCVLLCPAGTAWADDWFRGDLHAHSLYSDGDSPAADVIARAEALGLDFFVLTEHDTSLGGDPRHWSDPAYASDRMVLLYGMEWTTPLGHANIWGAEPFPYEALWQANRSRDARAAVAAAHAVGALFSINHPASAIFSLPWEYPVPDGVDAIEVWNSLYRLPSLNRWAGHYIWDDLLSRGRHLPAVGGSDTHMLTGWMSRFWGPGNPTTWVYAEALTADAILAGIKAGHATISYAPDAVRVVLSADADADGIYETLIGDTLPATGQPVSFHLSIETPGEPDDHNNAAAAELDRTVVRKLEEGSLQPANITLSAAAAGIPVYLAGVFKNGRLFRVWALAGRTASLTFRDIAAGPAYYRVELIGMPDVTPVNRLLYGRVIALTNPVYVDAE